MSELPFVQNMLKKREESIAKLKCVVDRNLDLLIEAIKAAKQTEIDGQDFLDELQDEINELSSSGREFVFQAVDIEELQEDSKIFDSVIAEASRIGMVLCLEHLVRNKMVTGKQVDFMDKLNCILPMCDQQIANMVQLFDQMRQVSGGRTYLELMHDRMEEIRDSGVADEDIVRLTLGLSAGYAMSVCMMSLVERDTDKLREMGVV